MFISEFLFVCLFVCFLFVCVFNWSLSAETNLDHDGTRFEQNAQVILKRLYKHVRQYLVHGNPKEEETDLKI